jgi:CRISPR-associated protein Csb1
MTTTPAQSQAQSLLDQLYAQDHIVITASLKLTNGNFLQPTGFPDIGACIYRDKEGRRWCLVESEQSMANRLEAVCMKSPGVWVDDLKGLPLIVVKDKGGNLLATNLTEPHRIASSYILEGKRAGDTDDLRKLFEEKIGLENKGNIWPLDKRANLEKLVFALDPAALLHGFQFVQWKFVGLRQTRLIHARLEAELADDPEVHYVVVKCDAIEPESTSEGRANKGQSIAAKSRIVPKNVTATFEIDVLALKNLSLKEDRKKFLLGLALWKIGAFLNNNQSFDPRSRATWPSLRLRADCYLTCDVPISWSGNSSSKGETTPTELMKEKPAGLGQAEGPSFAPDTQGNEDGKEGEKSRVTFRALVEELLPDKKDDATAEKPKGGKSSKGAASEKESSSDEKKNSLYDGPMVEVTYEPKQNQENKPKQEKKGGSKAAQQTEANVEQAGEAQE